MAEEEKKEGLMANARAQANQQEELDAKERSEKLKEASEIQEKRNLEKGVFSQTGIDQDVLQSLGVDKNGAKIKKEQQQPKQKPHQEKSEDVQGKDGIGGNADDQELEEDKKRDTKPKEVTPDQPKPNNNEGNKEDDKKKEEGKGMSKEAVTGMMLLVGFAVAGPFGAILMAALGEKFPDMAKKGVQKVWNKTKQIGSKVKQKFSKSDERKAYEKELKEKLGDPKALDKELNHKLEKHFDGRPITALKGNDMEKLEKKMKEGKAINSLVDTKGPDGKKRNAKDIEADKNKLVDYAVISNIMDKPEYQEKLANVSKDIDKVREQNFGNKSLDEIQADEKSCAQFGEQVMNLDSFKDLQNAPETQLLAAKGVNIEARDNGLGQTKMQAQDVSGKDPKEYAGEIKNTQIKAQGGQGKENIKISPPATPGASKSKGQGAEVGGVS